MSLDVDSSTIPTCVGNFQDAAELQRVLVNTLALDQVASPFRWTEAALQACQSRHHHHNQSNNGQVCQTEGLQTLLANTGVWQSVSSSTGRVSASGAAAGFGSGGVRSGKSSCPINDICNSGTGAVQPPIKNDIVTVRHTTRAAQGCMRATWGQDAQYSSAPRC